jgi:hypothetical protein
MKATAVRAGKTFLTHLLSAMYRKKETIHHQGLYTAVEYVIRGVQADYECLNLLVLKELLV